MPKFLKNIKISITPANVLRLYYRAQAHCVTSQSAAHCTPHYQEGGLVPASELDDLGNT